MTALDGRVLGGDDEHVQYRVLLSGQRFSKTSAQDRRRACFDPHAMRSYSAVPHIDATDESSNLIDARYQEGGLLVGGRVR